MKRNTKSADCLRPRQRPSARSRSPMQRRWTTAVGDCPMQSQTLSSRVSICYLYKILGITHPSRKQLLLLACVFSSHPLSRSLMPLGTFGPRSRRPSFIASWQQNLYELWETDPCTDRPPFYGVSVVDFYGIWWWRLWLYFFFCSRQMGAGRMDLVQRDVRRRNPDARFDLQTRDFCHVDDESQRGRLSKCSSVGAQGSQLQFGQLRQMAHLRMGKSMNS